MELLSYSNEQLKQYCDKLSNEEKVVLYKQLLEKAKDIIENSKDNTIELKKLSKVAVVIEKTIDKELLKAFDDDHPLRKVNIVIYSPEGNTEMTNYLFSIGESSERYDIKEDKNKALYQAIKSNEVELLRHLLVVLLPHDPKEIDLKYLKELVIILLALYEKLKPNLEKDMEDYLQKKLKFYNFLDYARINEKSLPGLIELFTIQTEIDYQIDTFLLSLIVEKAEKKELCAQVNNVIELLEKYKRVDALKYQIRKLQTKLISKNGYSKEIIQSSIEEREGKMKEIDAIYIKTTDLTIERDNLLKQLKELS